MNKYQKAVFQLNELIRHLLIDGDDVKKKCVGSWIDSWERIEKDNQEVFDEVYTDNFIEKDNMKL